ncbi:GABA permease-like protein [Podospora fimiseda]|uniref:GABA permease-like protein n=1 Tax=Podospora fimiseda TaxID=252190 RepID=A0AAN7H6H3_9PEZI|nr:GABA permease-like protein [Podospora fimiseda]
MAEKTVNNNDQQQPKEIEENNTENLQDGFIIEGHTQQDRADMSRMGKIQQLKRNYRSISALAFTVILQGVWEVLLTASYQGLVNGGPAGLIWGFIWTWFGMSSVILSLAEMASIAPTAGGQYHWVSEFSSGGIQKPLSFWVGWMSTLSWQAGTASGPFLVGTLIQGSVVLGRSEYVPENWHGTLIVIGVTVVVWAGNVYCGRWMPLFQNIMLGFHVFGFVVLVSVFWVLSPHATPRETFLQFPIDSAGWTSSTGLSLMVGQISAIYACICSDSSAHLSEEISSASTTVPKAIIHSYLLNGLLGLVFIITYAFTFPPSILPEALAHPTGYPHLHILSLALPNHPGIVILLNQIPTILIFAGTLSFALSTSRQTWAFARDKGLPFSSWLSKVDSRLHTPKNSITLTCGITILLSLINIGSDVAFNAIISLNLVSLMLTYIVSISAVLYKRVTDTTTTFSSPWSLGKYGKWVNVMGIMYSVHAFFWCFWPEGPDVTLQTFNWAVVMFLGVGGLCWVDYLVRGRKVYEGPVVLVEGYKAE